MMVDLLLRLGGGAFGMPVLPVNKNVPGYRLNLLPALRRLDYHLFYAVQDDPNSDMRTVIVRYPDFDPNVPVEKLPPPITIRPPEWLRRSFGTFLRYPFAWRGATVAPLFRPCESIR